MIRPRFSLRGLLLATLAVAAFCYWRDRPRQMANQFVAAFRAKDKAAVDALLVGDVERKAIFPFAESDAKFEAEQDEQTFTQWLQGERRITFSIKGTWSLDGSAIATARGVSQWDGKTKTTPRVTPDSGAFWLQVQGMPPTDLPANWDGLLQPGQPSTLSSP